MLGFHYSNQEFTLKDTVMPNVRNPTSCISYSYGSNVVGHLNRWKLKNTRRANFEQSEAEQNTLMNALNALIASLKVFYSFTRPHASLGAGLGIISSSLVAIENLSDVSPNFIIGLLKPIVAFGSLTIYSAGINQLFDIDADKVNKPYLPLASGEMNLKTGIMIVTAAAFLAFVIAYIVGSRPLQWGVFLSFLIISAYSVNLPFLRWKKNSISATLSILSCRGVIVQLCTCFHTQNFVFGRQAHFTRSLAFGIIVVSIFSAVIAISKDIPDIEGDKEFGVHSFAASLGEKQVFKISLYLLQIVNIFAIFFGATSPHTWSKLITLLYAEYVLIPFVR